MGQQWIGSSPGRGLRRVGALAGAVVVLVCAAPLVAPAGAPMAPAVARASSSYVVHACDASWGDAQNLFSNPAPTNANIHTSSNCNGQIGSGDGLQVWSAGAVQGSQAGGWWFHAPPNTSINALLFGGIFSAWGGWVAHWATDYGGGGDPVSSADDCQSSGCNRDDGALVGVSGASMIGFGLWCDNPTCPANAPGYSIFGPAASANVVNVNIGITDPLTVPQLGVGGQLWSAGDGGWISGRNIGAGYPITVTATDPAGVCALDATIANSAGTPVWAPSADLAPDLTQGAPCGISTRSASWYPDLGSLATGSYTLDAQASNPAGWANGSVADAGARTLLIDNSLPSVTVSPTRSANAAGWYDAPAQVLVTGNPASGASPVASISCQGPGAPTGAQPGSQLTVDVGQPGGTVSCTSTSEAGNTSPAASTALKIDTQSPTVSFAGPSGWVHGAQTVKVTASEPTALSGIALISCQTDGGPWTTSAGDQTMIAVNTQGSNTIACYATTVAGVQGQRADDSVQIDNTAPMIAFADGPDQAAWHTTAQTISVTASKPAGLSALGSIVCTIAGHSTTYPATSAQASSETVSVAVNPPGGQLSCTATDSAGNVSAPAAWSFLIDSTAPTGAFEPPDPSNPDRVLVLVADTGSGVAGGQIQIETASGWQNLQTTFEAGAGTLSATVPDNSSLPDGTYQLRALVWDLAGNEATVTDEPSAGRPAAVTLPLRIPTELIVGRAQAQIKRCTVRRQVIHHANRREHRAPAAKLQRVCETVRVPHARAAVRLRYGQRATINGLLETVDGTPLSGQSVQISAQADGWGVAGAATISTDSTGRFTYTLPAGASRAVTFSYSGNSILRPSAATQAVAVIGHSTITISKAARAGARLHISGRLAGGFVPTEGVLVQLWYRVRGVPAGFAPFEHAIATNHAGRWSITFPLSHRARGYTYVFRAVISHQSGWPYLTTITKSVSRRVR